MSKLFTDADLDETGWAPKFFTNDFKSDLVYCPLPWQKQGLQQTASGYGAKLTSSYKVNFNGKLYRIYHTCYGNASSAWFIAKGKKIYVH